MVRVELSDEEAAVLVEALRVHLTEFKREVAGTENPDFRHRLQQKQTTLERILGELSGKRG
jgi:hypothetical protein